MEPPVIRAPKLTAADPPGPSPEGAPAVLPRYSSAELLRGAAEAVIVHQGREYRLRLTQNRKLILTA